MNPSYDEGYLETLRQSLLAAVDKPTVYTQHLLPGAQVIDRELDFGPTFVDNLNWLTSRRYIGPNFYFTNERDTSLKANLDADFSGFFSETLEFVRASFEMIFSPNYGIRLSSCKMHFKGKPLHKFVNTIFG